MLEFSEKLPGSSVLIMPATWRDLNALRKLEHICFEGDSWPLLDLIGILSIPGVIRLKAVVSGDMVGFIAGDIKEQHKLAWIATVCVHPDFRRRGIGRDLVYSWESQANVPNFRLSVRTTNLSAIALYEKLGYRQIGRWDRYYNDGGDAFVMEKELRL